MRWSRALVPTLKEIPADAEVPSHRLMLKAGLIRKLASGTYTYLPLGWRSLMKVMAIVRQEMDAAGALEILMPAVQPIELWQKTGRDVDYGETMCRFKDRHGRENVLAPTAEEVVTSVAAAEIRSYRQLPVNLYQISFKFRDEFRPRFGVLRSREFVMKDAYSFNATEESIEETYRRMYDAYCRIFERCGLKYVIVEAESGEMGGSGSHQFTVPCESGEDVIVHTEDGSYAANIEKAAVDPVPRAERTGDAPPPENIHTPNVGSIEAVCGFLKTKPEEMIKTLIYSVAGQGEGAGEGEDEVVVAVVRGDHELNPEKLTQALGGRRAELATPEVIERVSGAAVGFAGPVGIAGKVAQVLIDHAVAAMPLGVTGANRTDYHTRNVAPGRDFPLEGGNVALADIRNAVEGDTHDGRKLVFERGIEVGQVFKLGTKYSAKLGATFLDENGKEHPCLMGCYGIGVNRIVAAAIEQNNDKNGIIWPRPIAPYEVALLSLNAADEKVRETAEAAYEALASAGLEVIYDDRDVRAGVKFKDADLVGFPVRVAVGERSLAKGGVEVKRRDSKDFVVVPPEQVVEKVKDLLGAEERSGGHGIATFTTETRRRAQ
jgi:prolyl-tRNA synthetase